MDGITCSRSPSARMMLPPSCLAQIILINGVLMVSATWHQNVSHSIRVDEHQASDRASIGKK